MKARIYQPAKTAMQSGTAKTKSWILEFDPTGMRFIEPLMGWYGSSDTSPQISLNFESRDLAEAYAKKHGLAYEVRLPKSRTIRPKSYAANFAHNRVDYAELPKE